MNFVRWYFCNIFEDEFFVYIVLMWEVEVDSSMIKNWVWVVNWSSVVGRNGSVGEW